MLPDPINQLIDKELLRKPKRNLAVLPTKGPELPPSFEGAETHALVPLSEIKELVQSGVWPLEKGVLYCPANSLGELTEGCAA